MIALRLHDSEFSRKKIYQFGIDSRVLNPVPSVEHADALRDREGRIIAISNDLLFKLVTRVRILVFM